MKTLKEAIAEIPNSQCTNGPLNPTRRDRLTVLNVSAAAGAVMDAIFGTGGRNDSDGVMTIKPGSSNPGNKRRRFTRPQVEELVAGVLARVELVEGCRK
jgi:hypothetical protein